VRGLAILWLLLLSPLARGQAPVRGLDVDTFTFAVEPARITLGETTGATLRITAVDDDGATPLDGAPPTLKVSTGRLGAPRRVGPGVWEAAFTPPTEAFPHVAIVSATIERSDETAAGFVAIPLWGKGQTAVNTKPNSQVTVFIGADRFGPVPTGPSGEVSVPILVPPGPEHAVARSVDAVGNESQKSISLGVPAFNRLAAVALDEVVVGDASGTGRILVYVVDKKGAPLVDGRLVAKASVGTVAPPVEVAPGVFELVWRPGTAKVTEATVSVSLAGAPLSTAKARMLVIDGAPVRAEIVLPRKALSPDEDPALPVRIAIVDGAGRAVPLGAVRVVADHGWLEGATASDVGRQLTWVLPRERRREKARLTVRAADGRDLGHADLILTKGRAVALRIDPPAPVVADGIAVARIAVTALDAAGNELSPQGVSVDVDGGPVLSPLLDPDARRLRAGWRPLPRDEAGTALVRARLGGLEATAPMTLLARSAASVLVGVGGGVMTALGDVTSAGGEVSVLLRLPVLDGSLHTGLSLGAWEGLAGASSASFSRLRTFPLLAEAAWRPDLVGDLSLHLGVVGGLVVTDAIAPKAGVEARAVDPGIAGGAVVGVAWAVGPGVVEVDGRVIGAVVVDEAPLLPMAPLTAGLVLGYRFGL
jgi:hypothetical protein